jgi:hypothetical protein
MQIEQYNSRPTLWRSARKQYEGERKGMKRNGKERKGKERKGRTGKERKGKERKGKPCIKCHKSVIFHVVMGAEPLARSR